MSYHIPHTPVSSSCCNNINNSSGAHQARLVLHNTTFQHKLGSPVRVPPRRIPAHYKTQIQVQIQDMLNKGIIEESSNPWLAPVVIVSKKSDEIRLCVDYRQLNKQTSKDVYPLPLPDEVQDCLAGSAIFSTLDLQNGYWQMPVNEADIPKTAFCQAQVWVYFSLQECHLA